MKPLTNGRDIIYDMMNKTATELYHLVQKHGTQH